MSAVVCLDCGQGKPIVARGLCGTCYQRRYDAGTLTERPTFRRVHVHGTPSMYNRGCSCDACREQNRRRMAAVKAELAQRSRDEVPHGLSGYRNWRCRCEVCTAANSQACREYKEYRARRGSVAS